MQEQTKEFSEEQRRALRQVYRYLLSLKGKKQRENSGEATDTETLESNTAYEGMTYEERLKAVYEKWARGELGVAEMTEMEWFYFQTAVEMESRKTDNLLENIEAHRLFWRRTKPFWQYLSEEERAAIVERLESGPLSLQDLDEIKYTFETAQWAAMMQEREQDRAT